MHGAVSLVFKTTKVVKLSGHHMYGNFIKTLSTVPKLNPCKKKKTTTTTSRSRNIT
jgi:hypothetical protein